MLYDPKWEVKTVFDLPRLIAWLEQKPADEQYCYLDNGNCLLGQYFKFTSELEANADHGIGGEYVDIQSGGFRIPDEWIHIAIGNWGGDVARSGNWTFGAALIRAREVLSTRLG